jgi:hypothetical protein
MIATAKWEKVMIEVGTERGEELKTWFWKNMTTHGCRTARFEDSYESA